MAFDKVGIFLALGLFSMFAVFGYAILMKLFHKPHRRKAPPRGFEVKLTEQNSVTEKEENDHG